MATHQSHAHKKTCEKGIRVYEHHPESTRQIQGHRKWQAAQLLLYRAKLFLNRLTWSRSDSKTQILAGFIPGMLTLVYGHDYLSSFKCHKEIAVYSDVKPEKRWLAQNKSWAKNDWAPRTSKGWNYKRGYKETKWKGTAYVWRSEALMEARRRVLSSYCPTEATMLYFLQCKYRKT